MPRLRSLLLLLTLAIVAVPARADVLVLVHGYLGDARSWEEGGVVRTLAAAGWGRAGIITASPAGIRLIPGPGRDAPDRLYLVDLPSQAPVLYQAELLGAMLKLLRTGREEEPLYLAGHSAGGVVARAALVRGLAPDARALVTIASPHLGTDRALDALDFTDDHGPTAWVKRLFVGDLYDAVRSSRGLLVDLAPARPGSLLHWLNRQPHPDIAYFAIVRGGPVGLGDELVPATSQDMNRVPAIQGRARVLEVADGHGLSREDGRVLVRFLRKIREEAAREGGD